MPRVSEQTSCENPKVSVAMITYNHEKFIAQAIESVLMQEANFPVELVIGEDCSTDGTRVVVLDYQRRHPRCIRVLTRAQNLGMLRNAADTYLTCRGRYVAFLEGDDYWCSSSKLQQQADFMDAQPDFAICFHNAAVVGDRSDGFPALWCRHVPAVTSAEDLAFELFIPTCSAMIRNGLIKEFPPWFFELPMGDWPLFLLVAQKGKIRFINKVMAHYRRHFGGVWTGESHLRNTEKLLRAVHILDRAFDYRFTSVFRAQEFWCWCDLAVKYDEQGRPEEAAPFRKLARRCLLSRFASLWLVGQEFKTKKLNKIFRLCFPRTWSTLQRLRNKVLCRETTPITAD
jgi:glycosyltransferase involved in cell wall biosynthesis